MASPVTWWQSRHMLHKLGAIGILVATLLFLIGFCVPAWTTQFGLWMRCSSSLCTSSIYSYSDVWINTVRVIECVAMLAYVMCCLMEFLHDCFQCSIRPPYDRTVEVLAGIAGIASITGTTIFGIRWHDIKTTSNSPVSDGLHGSDYSLNLGWGFGLVVAASIIILISAVAIGFSRHRHAQSMFSTTKMSVSKTRRRENNDQEISFHCCQDLDSASMMLVPASHFDTNRILNNGRSDLDTNRIVNIGKSDPPPYTLPPPYPYPSACDFILPIANSSMMPQIAGTSSVSGQSQVTGYGDQSPSLPGKDRVFVTPCHSFMTSPSAFCIQNRLPVMRPLFIKTSDGGSEIEITPSAQNSSGLPSPFSRF